MAATRYVLGQRIGEGASAEVFEAFLVAEDGFQRRVAIKRAKSGGWGEEERARFVGEARVASALHHANVAAVLDYGFMDGAPFLVFELVEGLDLSALRRAAGSMSEEAALIIAVDVAHALAYVHSASDHQGRPLNIVHRDLSPANVLLSWSADVKLGDFGVARGASRALTMVGTVKGTPGFMAPEQLTGAHLDLRADLFGLGCLLGWMITGTSPMEREEERRRVLGGAPLSLPSMISEDVRRVLSRVLSPARHQRHGSAAELADELGQLMLRRLSRDPRTALLSWLAKHPLAPQRLGRSAVTLPALVTGHDDGPGTATVRVDDPLDTPRYPEPADDPTLPAESIAALHTSETRLEIPRLPPRRPPR